MTTPELNQRSPMQDQLGQALANCVKPGDVLRLLDEFRQRQQHMPNTGNMATAMHRIASTGSQEASDREKVIDDRRFQQLVVNVEHNLKQAPETFGEQHLANVVWGAAKLRLQRGPLFDFVQREVLSPRRQLDKFSPQQLAAIAWSYAMVNYEAPMLFEAVQDEAMRKPPLAEMLSKAGLLRGGSGLGGGQRGAPGVGGAGAGRPASDANNPAMGGMGNYGSAPGQLAGMGAGLGNNVANAMAYQANHAGGANMQQRAQQPGQQGYGGQVPTNKGGPGHYGQQQQMQQSASAGYGASNMPSAHDLNKGSEVARVAEEHKKEMEEKQRQVFGGCEEGGEVCPLCVEEMDATDMALIPCPCGYQVCLLCLNKIRNEGNKQCPACRSEYEEDKFKKVDPLPKKKKGEEGSGDVGWESGGTKKTKTNKKAPVPLTFPGFSPKVAEMFAQCHEAGIISKGDLDERVMEDLKVLPERGAIAVLSEFMKKDMTRIRNKSAFVNGIIDRVQKELVHDKVGAGAGPAASNQLGWQAQQQQMGYSGPAGTGERSVMDSSQRAVPAIPAPDRMQQQREQREQREREQQRDLQLQREQQLQQQQRERELLLQQQLQREQQQQQLEQKQLREKQAQREEREKQQQQLEKKQLREQQQQLEQREQREKVEQQLQREKRERDQLQQQLAQQKAMAARPPQQAGIIGGMRSGGAAGMGGLGWSGAGDDDLDQMQHGVRGLSLGGSDPMGSAVGQSLLSSLQQEDEVELARQQVQQFLMSRAGMNAPPQKQQQQFPGGMSHGVYPPVGGGMGSMGIMGFPSDTQLGGNLVGIAQAGAVRNGAMHNLAPPPALRAPGPIGPLHGRQSDEQARAGAEAGSRLLEYITRGANGAIGEESKSKLPLFMRVNGAHQGAHHPGSTLSNDGTGDVDGWNTEIEERPVVAKASWEEDADANMDRCFQCGRDGRGDLDQTDGQFYCNDCWGAFEVWRSSQPVNATTKHPARRGVGDIPA